MGMIDRDYMHEERSGSAFKRAPEKSAIGTLFRVLIFVAALFLLYKLADWQLAKRTNPSATQSITASPSTPRKAPTRHETLPQAIPQHPSPRPYQQAPDLPASHRVVTKCMTNGKISYGDGPCANGAVATEVTTRADQNIMAPVRVTTAMQPEATFSLAPVLTVQSTAPSDHAAKNLECQSLDARVQYLDSISRQPQSGQMMDWIKDERQKARDRQFRIPCRWLRCAEHSEPHCVL